MSSCSPDGEYVPLTSSPVPGVMITTRVRGSRTRRDAIRCRPGHDRVTIGRRSLPIRVPAALRCAGRPVARARGKGRHRMLGLLVRALRWRAGATAAVLVVATVAGLAATLGPLYARSTEESLVLDRVARAGAGTTDVEVTASTVAQLPGVNGQSAKLDAVALADAMKGDLAAQTR